VRPLAGGPKGTRDYGDGIDIGVAGINYKKQLQRQKHTHTVLIMRVGGGRGRGSWHRCAPPSAQKLHTNCAQFVRIAEYLVISLGGHLNARMSYYCRGISRDLRRQKVPGALLVNTLDFYRLGGT